MFSYWSLDETKDKEKVYEYLDKLELESKISYSIIDDDVIKIEDIGMIDQETKALQSFFSKNDVIECHGIEDDDDEGGYFDDEFYDNDEY